MNYDWYELFNLTEFVATGLVSRTLKLSIEGVGEVDVLITVGNWVSIVYDGVMLPIGFAGKNPYAISPYAVLQDTDANIWLGIEVPEEE